MRPCQCVLLHGCCCVALPSYLLYGSCVISVLQCALGKLFARALGCLLCRETVPLSTLICWPCIDPAPPGEDVFNNGRHYHV